MGILIKKVERRYKMTVKINKEVTFYSNVLKNILCGLNC